jgi:hypothetical protein
MEGPDVADIEVKFQLPPDLREITVELADDMKPPEIINELLKAEVINPNPQGYLLAIKGGDFINNDTELRALNLQPGTVIRVVGASDAGCVAARGCSDG